MKVFSLSAKNINILIPETLTMTLKEELIEMNIILRNSGKTNPRYKYILYRKPEYLQKIVEETCFLKYDAPIRARIQCILQDIVHQPKCKLCENPCSMILNGSKYNNKFSKYCSRRCGGLDSKNLIKG